MEEGQMGLGAAAFWLFVGAAVVAVIWRKKQSEAMRHETVRLLIAKEQKLDDAQIAKLLNPEMSRDWMMWKQSWRLPPGSGYRTLRICGIIVIFTALGLAIAGLWRGMVLGLQEESVVGLATAVPIVTGIGIGLFFASRFAPKPPKDDNTDKKASW
jgi:hypothetical protein